MNFIFNNLKKIFSNINYIFLFLFISSGLGIIVSKYTNYELIVGNMGLLRANLDVFTSFLVIVLFATFVCAQVYKIRYFKSFNTKEASTSTVGTFFGIIVAGCPACAITLASYVGIASTLTLLPFHGLELKIIGILLLLYSNYSILKSLEACQIKIHAKRKN